MIAPTTASLLSTGCALLAGLVALGMLLWGAWVWRDWRREDAALAARREEFYRQWREVEGKIRKAKRQQQP